MLYFLQTDGWADDLRNSMQGPATSYGAPVFRSRRVVSRIAEHVAQ